MGKRKISIVIICISAFILLNSLTLVNASGGSNSLEVGFTIVPTKIASITERVELRAGIINDLTSPTTLKVDFIADGKTIKTETVNVQSKGYKLSETWWTPTTKGCKVLGIIVKDGTKVIAEEYRIITVIDIDTPGPEIATIAWEEPLAFRDGIYRSLRAIKEADIEDQVDDMYSVGIDTIIICYPEFILYNTGAFYDSNLPALTEGVLKPLNYDLLEAFYEAAQDRGMNILVGIGRGEDLFTPINEPEFSKAVDLAVDVMEEIYTKYGHYSSFYGWYISHEPSNLSSNGELKFANAVIGELRENWPDKVVLLAPSGTPTMNRNDMNASQIDIFAFQDAVGAGYIPGQYTYDPEKRIADLDEAFSSYKAVMDTMDKHFWSDLESWEMTGPNYENAYPALWSRVRRQFEIEKKYVSAHSLYAFTGFLSSPESTVQIGGQKAVDLYEGYSEFAYTYMQHHGIHNHTISNQSIVLEVQNFSDISSELPDMIEVVTAECKIKLKVNVLWEDPQIEGEKAFVNGKISTPGLPETEVNAEIYLQEPVSSQPVSSEISESDEDSQEISISSSQVSENISSGIDSSSEYSSQETITSHPDSSISSTEDNVDENNNFPWIYAGIGIVIVLGISVSVIVYIRKGKNAKV